MGVGQGDKFLGLRALTFLFFPCFETCLKRNNGNLWTRQMNLPKRSLNYRKKILKLRTEKLFKPLSFGKGEPHENDEQ